MTNQQHIAFYVTLPLLLLCAAVHASFERLSSTPIEHSVSVQCSREKDSIDDGVTIETANDTPTVPGVTADYTHYLLWLPQHYPTTTGEESVYLAMSMRTFPLTL